MEGIIQQRTTAVRDLISSVFSLLAHSDKKIATSMLLQRGRSACQVRESSDMIDIYNDSISSIKNENSELLEII